MTTKHLFIGISIFLFFALTLAKPSIEIEYLNRNEMPSCENPVENGNIIQILYRGTLTETGEVFDQSESTNHPFTFEVGKGNVIPGLDEGVMGMCEMEVRKLVIPPELAYGDQSVGHIPASSSLTFEILLTRNLSKNRPSEDLQPTSSISQMFIQYWWIVFLLLAGIYLYLMPQQQQKINPQQPQPMPSKNKKKRN